MISAQGTVKAIKEFDRELQPVEEKVNTDTNKFKARFGGQ